MGYEENLGGDAFADWDDERIAGLDMEIKRNNPWLYNKRMRRRRRPEREDGTDRAPKAGAR